MYEAFAALQRGRGRLRRSDDVFMFLLRTVVHRARASATRVSGPGAPDDPGLPNDVVLDALRALPGPQREALVLRYYGQLPDEQAAEAMGVPPGELRANVSRGMAALRSALSPCGHPQPGHMAK
jgi:DNA-directed RNA polymerase specialized sigma24 family protein